MMSPDQRHLDRESRSAELGTVPIKPNMSSGLTAPRPCTAGLCLIRCRLQRVPRRGFLRLSRTPIRGCRLLGWNSIYVPSPAAPHRYRVTAERRSTLPKDINHSVKNRFVLRLKSIAASLYGRELGRSHASVSPSFGLCFCESALQSLPSCTFCCISRGIFAAQIDSRPSERRYRMLVPMSS